PTPVSSSQRDYQHGRSRHRACVRGVAMAAVAMLLAPTPPQPRLWLVATGCIFKPDVSGLTLLYLFELARLAIRTCPGRRPHSSLRHYDVATTILRLPHRSKQNFNAPPPVSLVD